MSGLGLLFIMFVVDNIFTDGLEYSQKNNNPKEDNFYAPWEEEFINFKKTPQLKSYRRKSQPRSRSRFSSQLESYTKKSKELVPSHQKRANILKQKSVTIEYEVEPHSASSQKHNSPDNKIKLPLLPPKKGKGNSSPRKTIQTEDLSEYQSKNKNPQRYASKLHTQNNLRFEIYKRMLIAARQRMSNNFDISDK